MSEVPEIDWSKLGTTASGEEAANSLLEFTRVKMQQPPSMFRLAFPIILEDACWDDRPEEQLTWPQRQQVARDMWYWESQSRRLARREGRTWVPEKDEPPDHGNLLKAEASRLLGLIRGGRS